EGVADSCGKSTRISTAGFAPGNPGRRDEPGVEEYDGEGDERGRSSLPETRKGASGSRDRHAREDERIADRPRAQGQQGHEQDGHGAGAVAEHRDEARGEEGEMILSARDSAARDRGGERHGEGDAECEPRVEECEREGPPAA